MNGKLDERMKKYEYVTRQYVYDLLPIIVRVDMKNAKSYTSKMFKPFDSIFINCMLHTMTKVAENIQKCVFAYSQSDEISFLIYSKNYLADNPFNGNVQKIVSITASLATYYFNDWMRTFWEAYNRTDYSYTLDKCMKEFGIDITKTRLKDDEMVYNPTDHPALFDSRAFNIPKEEVTNYMIYREQDASKNSIYMLARTLYSHKQLQGLNGKELQDKMFTEKGVNWNDLPIREKRGMCICRFKGSEDKNWTPDFEIPIFTQDRDYIERFV